MDFSEFYNSKCKFTQKYILTLIGKKSFDCFVDRVSSRYWHWKWNITQKTYDLSNPAVYREVLLTKLHNNERETVRERLQSRFTEEENDIIQKEYERQKVLKRIRRQGMSKNEYDILDVPKEIKQQLELIEIHIMRILGYTFKEISKELNISDAWVGYRYRDFSFRNKYLTNPYFKKFKLTVNDVVAGLESKS